MINENKFNYHNYQMQPSDINRDQDFREQDIGFIQPLTYQQFNTGANGTTNGNDIDIKKQKQEEYKRILDQQRQETFDRIANNAGTAFQPGIDQQQLGSKGKGNVNQYDEQKENEFLKEKERKKKMEYNQYLMQQIQERKNQKEIEKKKEKEEEEKYEKKYYEMTNSNQADTQQLPLNLKRNKAFNQMLTTEEQIRLQKQQEQLELQQQQQRQEQIQPQPQLNHYQTSNYSPEVMNSIRIEQLNLDKPTLSNTQSNPQMIHSPYIDQMTSSQPLYDLQCNQSPNTIQSPYAQYHEPTPPPHYSNNQMTYNPRMNYPMTPSPIQSPYYQQPQPQPPMISYDKLNELFQMFMTRQMSLITEYEKRIEYFTPTILSNDFINTLLTERNSTMEKIKTDQEAIRNCIGYYPMQNEYNNKISNLLNLIIEKKIDKLQTISTNTNRTTDRAQSAKQTKHNIGDMNDNNNHNCRINESLAIQSKVFNNTSRQIQQQKIKQQQRPLIESQIYRDAKKCNYVSVYEDLKQSIMNFDDAMPQVKESLAGCSKLVKPITTNNNNPNKGNSNSNKISSNGNRISGSGNGNSNSQNLFQTWKSEWKQDINDRNGSKLESIQEEMNNNNQPQHKEQHQKEEKPLYNVSQSKILMTKSNCTLTEKSFTEYQKEFNNKDNNIPQLLEPSITESTNQIRNDNICNPNFYVEDDDDEESKVTQKEDEMNKMLKRHKVKSENNVRLDNCNRHSRDNNESQKFQTQLNYFEDSNSIIDYSNVNKSKPHVITQSKPNANKVYQRPPSPKLTGNRNLSNNNSNAKSNSNNKPTLHDKSKQKTSTVLSFNTSSCLIKDSYGDNIIKDLNKYRQIALDESSIQNSMQK